uniref:hypothetical protein n=1 Tax=Cupriavidus taiwanensis TaxID=164546 RepID=UPI0018DDE48D|nr:hypothetical protein [Cupriavidus taiwanensis]
MSPGLLSQAPASCNAAHGICIHDARSPGRSPAAHDRNRRLGCYSGNPAARSASPSDAASFEKLAELAAQGGLADAKAIGALRARYDTDQLSALTVKP